MAARLINITYPAAAGGTVRFYQPGTLVQANVYSNDAATMIVTQPVQIDATGKTSVALYSITPVRAIFYNSNGSQIQDDEREVGERSEIVSLQNTRWPLSETIDEAFTNLAISLGSTDGNSKASFAGAINRTVQARLEDVINVKDFGAKGDDITINDNAFSAAIGYAATLGKTAVVRIPAGTYRFNSTITAAPSNSTNRVILQGDGLGSTVLKAVAFSATSLIVTSALSSFPADIKDLSITNTAAATSAAITAIGTLSANYFNLDISGFRTGIVNFSGFAFNVTITTDSNAAASAFDITGFTNASNIFFCNMSPSGGAGVRIRNGAGGVPGVNIVGCKMVHGSAQGILCEAGQGLNNGTIALNNFYTGTASPGGITCSADAHGLPFVRFLGNFGNYSIAENAASTDIVINPVAGVLTLDLSKSRYFKSVLAAATSITITNPNTGSGQFPHHDEVFTLVLQNSTGGGFAITSGANVVLQTGGFTVAATSQSVIHMQYDSNAAKLIQTTAPVAMAVT